MGAESVMAPSGLWGKGRSSLLTIGEKRRKAEVSTPLLYYRAERVLKGRRFGGRSTSAERQSSGSALPIEAILREWSREAECTKSCRGRLDIQKSSLAFRASLNFR